ncbi:hypothetical protein K469DRAFT_810994 [Zopfia rhizophila CBS 207.26]|uniref:Uncharacterized protein n=1 Tax=Zopfia rhizophila CBS 207.26 TaxID=1314779 RepID=A0A6A6EHR8_9PEZI|nr:hypothetical protein K469DRAFT_810994 [Zopfia rhizophila CBS 207.26]
MAQKVDRIDARIDNDHRAIVAPHYSPKGEPSTLRRIRRMQIEGERKLSTLRRMISRLGQEEVSPPVGLRSRKYFEGSSISDAPGGRCTQKLRCFLPKRAGSALTPRQLWNKLFINFYKDHGQPNIAMIILDGLGESSSDTLKEFFSLLNEINTTSSDHRLSSALFQDLRSKNIWAQNLSTSVEHQYWEAKRGGH